MRGVARLAAAALALAAVTACTSGPSATRTPSLDPSAARSLACENAVLDLVAAVERTVAVYDAPTVTSSAAPSAGGASSPPPTNASPAPAESPAPADDLATVVVKVRQTIAENGCPTTGFARDLQQRLGRIQPRSAIGKAVLARVTATLTGRAGQQAGTRRVGVTDNLATVLAESAAGSTIQFGEGTFKLPQSLVLLDGITLKGAGQGKTILRSTAADAAIVIVTGGRVEVADLSLSLDSSVPATGVLAGPLASLVLNRVAISGAKATPEGLGGAGVQMSGRGTEGSGRGTTLEVTDSRFFKNSWAGIAVGGGHQVSIVRANVAENGQCGICFLDASTGSVSASTFSGNVVALGATGTSQPTWLSLSITGGTVGLQVDGQAAPRISEVTVTRASRAAVIFSGASGGAITKSRCTGVPYGIVVADTAAPTLGDNACTIARGG